MYKAAVLVISDKAYEGVRQDETGKQLVGCLEKTHYTVVHYGILPKELPFVSAELMRICDEALADLVLTVGATGFSANDIAPEATQAVTERACNGIPEALRAHRLSITKEAILSRATAGIRNSTLIVNLPGVPEQAVDCLEFILPEMTTGVAMLRESSHIMSCV